MKVIKRYSKNGGGIQTPDGIIIHSMSERFMYEGDLIHASELLERIGLSAHFLILPNGEVMKLRKTTEKAWHAKWHNTNTIGIEVLVKGLHNYDEFLEKIKTNYVDRDQMESLIELTKGIQQHYDIDKGNILRHSDIDPDRKVDPGIGFDWEYFKSKLL